MLVLRKSAGIHLQYGWLGKILIVGMVVGQTLVALQMSLKRLETVRDLITIAPKGTFLAQKAFVMYCWSQVEVALFQFSYSQQAAVHMTAGTFIRYCFL